MTPEAKHLVGCWYSIDHFLLKAQELVDQSNGKMGGDLMLQYYISTFYPAIPVSSSLFSSDCSPLPHFFGQKSKLSGIVQSATAHILGSEQVLGQNVMASS